MKDGMRRSASGVSWATEGGGDTLNSQWARRTWEREGVSGDRPGR